VRTFPGRVARKASRKRMMVHRSADRLSKRFSRRLLKAPRWRSSALWAWRAFEAVRSNAPRSRALSEESVCKGSLGENPVDRTQKDVGPERFNQKLTPETIGL
jgi:hypothetical protein